MKTESNYLFGYIEGRDESIQEIYNWLMDDNREPAVTRFADGWKRNLAKEIEFKINEARKRYPE